MIRRSTANAARSVDHRRLLQLAGHRLERDPHHERRERQLVHGQDQAEAEQRVADAQLPQQHVQRDQQRRAGHHQDREGQQEQQVPARELEPGECVAAERRDASA